jgi:glycosyltransferase involved in cell wall biosynthesis
VIVGSGIPGDVARLDRLVRRRGLGDAVTMMGRVEGSDKWRLIADSRVMVVSSRSETFCTTALEAAAYGAPIACFDIEGLAWLPDDCRCTAAAMDAASLATAIATLLGNEELSSGQAARAREHVTRYDWETVAAGYAAVVRKVLDAS